MDRSPADIQREIEQARDALGSTLDQLVDRTSPKNLAARGKASAMDFAKSQRGQLILGGVAAAFVGLVVLTRLRNR
ncbi:MAG: DUF3618 domain-containing protein [Geodermatophilaceae bacterium]|nr:DUF3618 domain-containing protein [Geodermatophilaceae bacterium]